MTTSAGRGLLDVGYEAPRRRSLFYVFATVVGGLALFLLLTSFILLQHSADVAGTPASLDLSIDNFQKADTRQCDLYRGKWIYDPMGPLYTNSTCPIITREQNCRRNGRPDRDYENWRWKPEECDLPRLDPRKFLELMRGKTIVFIGDSVARNQMQSLICTLWQVETPRNMGNHNIQRWYFGSTSTTIVRIWICRLTDQSAWLVHHTTDPIQFAPKGLVKVHPDTPDMKIMEILPKSDVAVISSGHWFTKRSAYVLTNTIVGGQSWWPKGKGEMEMNNIKAYGKSMETALTAVANHPDFNGLAILRTFTPSHYGGGAWNTGGSCSGKVMPSEEIVRSKFTDVMYEQQVKGFKHALDHERRSGGGSKLRLMDVTGISGYRHDGHPGRYGRQIGPNDKSKWKRQDCLHWCLPGPIDTWNDILFETIRREFEGA